MRFNLLNDHNNGAVTSGRIARRIPLKFLHKFCPAFAIRNGGVINLPEAALSNCTSKREMTGFPQLRPIIDPTISIASTSGAQSCSPFPRKLPILAIYRSLSVPSPVGLWLPSLVTEYTYNDRRRNALYSGVSSPFRPVIGPSFFAASKYTRVR